MHHDPLLPIDPDQSSPSGHESTAHVGRPALAALAVGLGGAVGGLARLGAGELLAHRPGGFPWATFTVNVVGCALIGALMVVLLESQVRPSPYARPFLGIGLLGGFTTFSTYATDVRALLAGGHSAVGLTYLVSTVAVGLTATYAGLAMTRALLHVPTPADAA